MAAKKQFKCNHCGSLHEKEGEANACCADVSVVYQCTICEMEHDDEHTAEMCCTDEDEESSYYDGDDHEPFEDESPQE